MRFHVGWVLTMAVCLLLSCAALPPEKEFETELWRIDARRGIIERLDDNHVMQYKYLDELDPSLWVVIRTRHITGEWTYEKLLIKSCERWR